MKTVAKLRQILRGKPRDLLLFDLAIQTGVGINHLIRLKVKDLLDLAVGAPLPFADSPKEAAAEHVLNQQCYDTFRWYLKMVHPAPDDYLFPSRKGGGPLNLTSASHMIKKWFNDAHIEGLSGARSLKKTWQVFYRTGSQVNTDIAEKMDPTRILKPVETKTVQEVVYQELFQAIISGRIPPGEKLVTDKIANRMNVSPMPVRDALYRLQAAGFISTRRKIGSIVNELSPENLEEITEIRLALEPMAASKAAVNPGRKTLKRLEDLHAAFLTARADHNIEAFLSINREFHHTIYREADMPILLPIIDGLWGRISPYLHILMKEQDYSGSEWAIKTHEGMLNGMRSGKPDKVVKYVKADLTKAAQALMNMFARMRN
ncbi:MAG: FCD domain-containing protein [Desulfobacterales bacterium]|nr:MAG: FCD domain-containing protein [Desulfobacterales bacterium]